MKSIRLLVPCAFAAMLVFAFSDDTHADLNCDPACIGDVDHVTLIREWPGHRAMGRPYCDVTDFPVYRYEEHSAMYRTFSGRVSDRWLDPEGRPDGDVVTHVYFTHWCENTDGKVPLDDDGEPRKDKQQWFWLPEVSEDAIMVVFDLLARVEAQLTVPEVTWLNKDLDYDWLWVNVEHFARLEPVENIRVSETVGDEWTGVATAWVAATPAEFRLTLPGVDDMEGTTTCNLTTATSPTGCGIIFRHASSIDPSGEFTGTVEIDWAVSSSSGRYEGVTFTTEGQFSTIVAEAMAVSDNS